jgi:hypothetical protein
MPDRGDPEALDPCALPGEGRHHRLERRGVVRRRYRQLLLPRAAVHDAPLRLADALDETGGEPLAARRVDQLVLDR